MRRQELAELLELRKFIPGFKERIATWKGWRNAALVLSSIAWLFLGMVVSLVDAAKPEAFTLLFALYALATLGFWIALLGRLKNTRVHLWVKTRITPETVPIVMALLTLLFILPLLIFSPFR